MFYIIGLGLCDENDVSLHAVEILKKCDKIYCELFTSRWVGDIEKLASIIGKDITLLTRGEVEKKFPIKDAAEKDIALLVPGDPFAATTHFELLIEAKKIGVKTEIIHASSIYTAVAETGLQLYKFGRTTTLPFSEENYKPKSQFEIINANKKACLHTLILLDVNQEKNNYMTALDGLKILNENGFTDAKIVACCNLGSRNKIIKYDTVSNLAKYIELDKSPAVLVVPGDLNFKEEEALKLWK